MCGIVDCQGFVKEGKFVPKEFAIAYSESRDSEIRRKLGKYIDKVILHHNSLCFGINTQLDEKDMNAFGLCVNGYIELTGLNYHPNSDRYITLEELPDLLCRLYNACKKRKTDVFGVNNNQFEHVLTDLGIPWTNVATPSFDELDDYFTGNWKCSLPAWSTRSAKFTI